MLSSSIITASSIISASGISSSWATSSSSFFSSELSASWVSSPSAFRLRSIMSIILFCLQISNPTVKRIKTTI